MEWTIVWFIDEWEWINNENICVWNHKHSNEQLQSIISSLIQRHERWLIDGIVNGASKREKFHFSLSFHSISIPFHSFFSIQPSSTHKSILNQSNKRQLFVFVLLIDEMKWWVDELLSCRPPPNKPQINEFHSHENSFDLLVLFGLAARGVSSLAPREMKRLIWFASLIHKFINKSNNSTFQSLILELSGRLSLFCGALWRRAAYNPPQKSPMPRQSIPFMPLAKRASKSIQSIHSQRMELELI